MCDAKIQLHCYAKKITKIQTTQKLKLMNDQIRFSPMYYIQTFVFIIFIV